MVSDIPNSQDFRQYGGYRCRIGGGIISILNDSLSDKRDGEQCRGNPIYF